MRLFILMAAAVLVGVMALTACNSRENSPKAAKNTVQQQPAPVPAGDNVRRITPAELKDEIAKNDVVIIDVRGEPAYKQGHIKGSRQIPATEILAHVDELPKDKLIVTYCS
jgi:predicted sulfurtransferase